jgi:hypothetical protein
VTKPYVPGQETLERYQTRVIKQARAFEFLGTPLGEGVLEVVLSRASYELKLYEETGSDPVLQLQLLKGEYATEIVDIDGSTAQAHRLSALESMLEAKGESIAELRDLVNYSEGARPQRSEPSLAPAARAEPLFIPIHGTGDVTPVVAAGTKESQFADMERQLRQSNAELAAYKLRTTHDEWGMPLHSPASPADSAAGIAEAIKMMAQALENSRSSSISVKPQIDWPTLKDDDDNFGIGGFFKDLEEIFAIDNSGKGMGHTERLVCLRMCLKGTRKLVYDNIVKRHKGEDSNPQGLYKEIKDELMRFSETAMEKTVRVRTDWKNFNRNRHMTALEFGTKFIKISTQLEGIGLPMNTKEKYMSYIEKVGVDMGQTIRLDRRQREDENGWWSERLPETWEEAHEVLIEREAVLSGSRNLKEVEQNTYPDPYVGQRGGGIDNGKGKGKGKGKAVCYNMRDRGVCAHEDHCRFSHDPKEIAQSRKDKGKEDKRGKILCKFIKDPALGECKHGDKCAYSHDPNKVKEVQQDTGPIGNRQDENDDDSDGWDKPVGIRGCGGIRSVIVTDAEYTEASRALQSRVSNRPGPRLSGWRATSLVDPVVEALQVEVAQLKEELATLKSTEPQSSEPGPETSRTRGSPQRRSTMELA